MEHIKTRLDRVGLVILLGALLYGARAVFQSEHDAVTVVVFVLLYAIGSVLYVAFGS